MADEKKPPIEIPILKEKQKERKGGGGWLNVGGAADSPGVLAGGQAIAVKGGFWAKFAAGGGVKALLASKLGIAAMALSVGGMGLVGFGLMQGGTAKKIQEKPQLGAISSTISSRKRNAKGSKSLSFIAKASEGELKWDKGRSPVSPGRGAQAETATADAPATTTDDVAADVMKQTLQDAGGGAAQKERLGGNFGKLSSQLGGSNAFGGKNIFNGASGFNVKKMKNMGGKAGGQRGLQASRGRSARVRSMKSSQAKKINARGIGANRAMGQLKFSGRRSAKAANAGDGTAASAQYASDAFSGQSTTGGGAGVPGAGLESGETIQMPGANAHEPASGGGDMEMPCAEGQGRTEDGFCLQSNPYGKNVTPYQEAVDKSWSDYVIWGLVAAAGIALMVWGYKLLSSQNPWTVALGVVMIIIGLALLMMAIGKITETEYETKDKVNEWGQKDQADIVEEGASDAKEGEEYDGPTTTPMDGNTDIHDDVEAEQAATYSEGGGG